jgi:hypothetical protein
MMFMTQRRFKNDVMELLKKDEKGIWYNGKPKVDPLIVWDDSGREDIRRP